MALDDDQMDATTPEPTDLSQIIDRGRDRPSLDRRSPDEIVGYDDDGLPA